MDTKQQPSLQKDSDEVYRDYYLAQMSYVFVPGYGFPILNQASMQIVLSWVNPDERLSRDFLVKVIQENPSLASQIQWRPESPKQAEAAQLAKDKQTFKEAAKNLRSFGSNDANLNVTRQILGPGFTEYDISQALASNALQLSPPNQEELDRWAAQDVEAHNEALLKADDVTLRARVRHDAEQARIANAQAEAANQLQAAQQRDAAMGFLPLPETWQGQKLDAAFIKNCSVEVQKLLTKRFGAAQLTARIQGRG
jgi:hypothetical protein